MKPFNYEAPTKVHFGVGMIDKIGALLSGTASKVLLVLAKGPFRENGVRDRVVGSLEDAGIVVYEMSDIESNPKLKSTREGKEVCNQNAIDAIVSVGGGSAMDAGKIIAAAAAMNVDPHDLIWGPRLPVSASLPVVTVPTIAATGTEVNNAAVLVNESTREKYWCLAAFPRIAIHDPDIVSTVPRNLTIWGAMDILSHTFEFYLNDDRESEMQNRLSEAILMATMSAIERTIDDPEDRWATGELMWDAVMAWGGLTKVGRGDPDMTCHSIEESFSGYFDTHHGACLAVLTPIWMERTAQHVPGPFARFARNVMRVDQPDDLRAANEGIKRYNDWLDHVGAPKRFSDFGPAELFTDEGLKHVATNCLRIYNGSIGRLRPIKRQEEVLEMLHRGREGR